MLGAETRLVALLGDPVAHSRSPLMQNAAFAARGLDWAYVACRVDAAEFDDAVRGLAALGFAGANVTIPHKAAAVRVCDVLDEVAERGGLGQHAGLPRRAHRGVEHGRRGRRRRRRPGGCARARAGRGRSGAGGRIGASRRGRRGGAARDPPRRATGRRTAPTRRCSSTQRRSLTRCRSRRAPARPWSISPIAPTARPRCSSRRRAPPAASRSSTVSRCSFARVPRRSSAGPAFRRRST